MARRGILIGSPLRVTSCREAGACRSRNRALLPDAERLCRRCRGNRGGRVLIVLPGVGLLASAAAGARALPVGTRPVFAAGARLALVTVILLPFVLCGLMLVGLADTWLDFRRRLTPSTGG